MGATLIVDSDDYAACGVETLFFPGGEPHAKIPGSVPGHVILHLKLRSWRETGLAACVIDALSRNERVDRLDVFIPYFPGARQDRSDGHAPLTVKLMIGLLTRHRGQVHVFDPHSEVLQELAAVRAFMPADLEIPLQPDVAGIIAPDRGATGRATAFRDRFYPGAALIQCDKRRDPTSGALTGFAMPALEYPGRYIIVDDICDGGGTFNLLAAEFRRVRDPGAFQLELFVSHGIFSGGIKALDPLIRRITTTDSWAAPGGPYDPRLTVVPLTPLLTVIGGDAHA